MAYKFQLGDFTASGSITAESGLNANAAGVASVGALAGVTTISGSGKFQMGSLAVGGTDITATAAELNILDGVTATAANLNQLSGVTLGNIVTQNSASLTVVNLTASALAISDVSGIAGAALENNNGVLRIATGGVTNTMLSGGIDGTKITTGAIGNTQLSGNISADKLQLAVGVMSSSAGVLTIAAGAVTNTMLSGNISFSKLASLSEANILIGDASGVAQAKAVSGDVTIDKNGVVAIGSEKVTNTMLSGGIEGTKIATGAIGNTQLSGNISADKLQLNLNQFSNGSGVLGLKSSISGALTFENNITVNGNLTVLGSTFSASVGTLLIEDALINIGDGQTSYADGYGIEFGTSGSSWGHIKTADLGGIKTLSSSFGLYTHTIGTPEWMISSTHISGNLPVSASAFYGDGSNLTGVVSTSLKLGGASNLVTSNATVISTLSLVDTNLGAFTLTLPAATSTNAGTLHVVKDRAGSCGVSGKALTIAASGSQTIDGAASIQLESNYAAVNLIPVFTGANGHWIVV